MPSCTPNFDVTTQIKICLKKDVNALDLASRDFYLLLLQSSNISETINKFVAEGKQETVLYNVYHTRIELYQIVY
jgi:uncharacterized lipoprotein YajG